MPGLIGFTSQNDKESAVPNLGMLTANIYNRNNHLMSTRTLGEIYSGTVNFEFDANRREYENYAVYITIYGDVIFNNETGPGARDKLITQIVNNFPGSFISSYIDGLFNILIYDKINKNLYIYTDQNGLSHLYYGVFDEQLFWSSELRSFLSIGKRLTINSESIQSYIAFGSMINNETWFHEVSLLPPASYLKWDLKNKKLSVKKYREDINNGTNNHSGGEDNIVNDLIDLFQDAVAKRYTNTERVGLTLSGGLDSRAIFAAINNEKTLPVITRGFKGCRDIKIAQKVVKKKNNVDHVVIDMNGDNWLDGRLEAVKTTTGQKSIIHMNAMSSIPVHKQYFDINLDGAGGDGILRGKHLVNSSYQSPREYLRKYIDTDYTFSQDVLDRLENYYLQVKSAERFYIEQRVRRFIIFGSVLGHEYGIISRFPFLDHNLQKYIMQVPQQIDRKRVYFKMLQKAYPDYYNIPESMFGATGDRLYIAARNNVSRGLRKIGIKMKPYNKRYYDYNTWLRNGKGKQFLEEMLLNKNNYMLQEHLPYEMVEKTCKEHMKGLKRSEKLSRYLTLQIMFQDISKVVG